MNQYVTGNMIKTLRERMNMTQLELAKVLQVSDKTISKWETGKGYPDITMLEPLAEGLQVSVLELLAGNAVSNTNPHASMEKAKWHVCPICGNVIYSVGEAVVSCHGLVLPPLEAEQTQLHWAEEATQGEDMHEVTLEAVEDEYFVTLQHPMTKEHYISFIAAITMDGMKLVKLYPEGNPETRVPVRGLRQILFYCNQDGLFQATVQKRK